MSQHREPIGARRITESRLEQVLKVTDLLLQSNGFGMIALDLGDIPTSSARRIPMASWFRFRRAVEHTPTVDSMGDIFGLAGTSNSDVWAIGQFGILFHWTGTGWTQVETGTRVSFLSLAVVDGGPGARQLWVAGYSGAILHYSY